MKIIERNDNWTVKDLIEGFSINPDTKEVTSMNGRLNVRPPYQRNYVWDQDKNSKDENYGGPKQQALINSVLNG